jgi:hypothetical protein
MSPKHPKHVSAPAKKPKKRKTAAKQHQRVDSKEEREFVRSLREHGQLHEGSGPLPPGATHVVRKKRGPHGKKTVERKRFSYV